MSSNPKSVYPLASEKGEAIRLDVLGVESAAMFTLAPGATMDVYFATESTTVATQNVISVWASGLASVEVGDVKKIGRNIIRRIDYDENPELPSDIGGAPMDWVDTTNPQEVIQGSKSRKGVSTPGKQGWLMYTIPEANRADFSSGAKEFRYQLDWTYHPGQLPPAGGSQLMGFPFRQTQGGQELTFLMEQFGSLNTPHKAAKGRYNAKIEPADGFNYGVIGISRTNDDAQDPMGSFFVVDNITLYIVGDGDDTTATNTYICIPKTEHRLSVGEMVTVRNLGVKLDPNDPDEPEPGSIRVVINQLTRWSQMANPGSYGATV